MIKLTYLLVLTMLAPALAGGQSTAKKMKHLRKQLVLLSSGRDSLTPGKVVRMSRCEITVAQFETFVKETGYLTDAEKKGESMVLSSGLKPIPSSSTFRHDHFGRMWPEDKRALYPVLHVSKNDAEAFCYWLSDLWKTEVSLPTSREWEAAAKGSPSSDRMIPGIISVSGENRHPKPVGSHGPNTKGICDLEGNVTEWISDRVEGNPFEASGVPANPEIGGCKMKGGYWLEGPLNPAFTRIGFKPDYRSFETGFRIVSRKSVKRK